MTVVETSMQTTAPVVVIVMQTVIGSTIAGADNLEIWSAWI